jgi:hypothetical protein
MDEHSRIAALPWAAIECHDFHARSPFDAQGIGRSPGLRGRLTLFGDNLVCVSVESA